MLISNNLEPTISDCIKIVDYYNDLFNKSILNLNPELKISFFYNGTNYGLIWNNDLIWNNLDEERGWIKDNEREEMIQFITNKIHSFSSNISLLFT